MGLIDVHQRFEAGARRRLLVTAAVFGATLLSCSGAYAQTSGGVDQYVEDVPSAGGTVKDKPKKDHVKPAVQEQIDEQGGTDAPALQEAVETPRPKLELPASPKKGVRDGGLSNAAPVLDVSNTSLDDSSSPLAGAETARLVGFLFVLFAISVATLTVAAVRQRQRA